MARARVLISRGSILARLLFLLAVPLFSSGAGGAETQRFQEYRVKAAFVEKLVRFVEWPAASFPDTNSPVVIGVFGRDPFGQHLQAATRNKAVSGRPIELRLCATADEVRSCHAVFISASSRKQLETTLSVLRNAPILTIGEAEGFAAAGGIVEIYIENERGRLRINKDAAKRAGLQLSAQLLQLSKIVHESDSSQK